MRFRYWVDKPFSRAEQYAGSMWFMLTLLTGMIMIRAWHDDMYRYIWAVGALWLTDTCITMMLFRELDRRSSPAQTSVGRHRADPPGEPGEKAEQLPGELVRERLQRR